MMGGMATPETTGNPPETLSDSEVILKHLSHLDEGVHEIERGLAEILKGQAEILAFINDHRPALARAMSLMDPGKAVRSMLPGGKRRG
jgi:hypothetical protein